MKMSTYGEILGMMWAAIPGSIGMWGILAGIQQGRIGPVITGVAFCFIGWFTYNIMHKAAQKWIGKEDEE